MGGNQTLSINVVSKRSLEMDIELVCLTIIPCHLIPNQFLVHSVELHPRTRNQQEKKKFKKTNVENNFTIFKWNRNTYQLKTIFFVWKVTVPETNDNSTTPKNIIKIKGSRWASYLDSDGQNNQNNVKCQSVKKLEILLQREVSSH